MDSTLLSINTGMGEESTEMLGYCPAIKINGIVLSFLVIQMSQKDAMLNEISQAQEGIPHILGLA